LSKATRAPMSDSSEQLCRIYDVALLDLDGVVYIGPDAVPGVPDALDEARHCGMRLAFVTNNAARPPSVVAAHLSDLGVAANTDEVITSSQAAAHYLADRMPAGARILVVGTVGLVEALQERGLTPVHSADDDPVAVVQGFSPDTDWRMLAEGAIAIRRGLPWIATNLDPTVPSPRGPLPGAGSLVAALTRATGRTPVSTGKPDPTMHRETVERTAATDPIVVGDRLDTDIQGATRASCDSLLVLTGVTDARGLLDASPEQRPTYLASDASGLLRRHVGPTVERDSATCGQWRVRSGGELTIVSAGAGNGDHLDALRALATSRWTHGWQTPTAGDDHARDELRRLGLTSD
jgi:HAD superfamily hydrolase (TIGR01450 family)